MKVSLDYEVVVWIQIVKITSQEYTAPLTGCLWLHDKSLFLIFRQLLKLFSEVGVFRGKQPGLREKVVVFRKALLHATHIPGE